MVKVGFVMAKVGNKHVVPWQDCQAFRSGMRTVV
jgi:hypothetical protein